MQVEQKNRLQSRHFANLVITMFLSHLVHFTCWNPLMLFSLGFTSSSSLLSLSSVSDAFLHFLGCSSSELSETNFGGPVLGASLSLSSSML